MSIDPELLELAAAWRPQRPGHKRPKDIREAIVEPDWMGLRVVAVVGDGEAVFVHEGEALTLPVERLSYAHPTDKPNRAGVQLAENR